MKKQNVNSLFEIELPERKKKKSLAIWGRQIITKPTKRIIIFVVVLFFFFLYSVRREILNVKIYVIKVNI